MPDHKQGQAIVDAVRALLRAFSQAGLEPPVAILMNNNAQVDILEATAATTEDALADFQRADGWRDTAICGLAFRIGRRPRR